jgi:hypothetical protein
MKKSTCLALFAGLGLVCLAGQAFGQANDECAGAIPAVLGNNSFDNSAATTSAGSPCGAIGTDLWYTFSNPTAGVVTVTTCNLTGGDSVLAAYSTCASVITCNDDTCGLQSNITFNATANTPYLLRVGGFAGEVWAGSFNISIAGGGSGNDECAGATPITPGVTAFDGSNATNSAAGTCGGIGRDLWYSFNTGSGGAITVTTCNQSASDTVLALYSDCNTALVCNDDTCGLQSTVSVCSAPANTTYYVRVGGYAGGVATGSFTLTIEPGGGGSYAEPAGAVAEGETCSQINPDNFNGGCNSTPNVYSTAQFCTTYAGTAANTGAGGFRDTDWYNFTMPADGTVTVTGQAEFPAQWFFLNTDCANIQLLAQGFTAGCNPDITMSGFLPAGQYTFFCSPQDYDGTSACGQNARYWFRMTTEAGCGPACGTADFNCDGDVGTDQDIEAFFACLAGNCPPAPCANSADFNGDGDVGTDADIEAFFRVLAGGNC